MNTCFKSWKEIKIEMNMDSMLNKEEIMEFENCPPSKRCNAWTIAFSSSCDETFYLFIYLNRMNGWQNVIVDERIVFDMCAIFCHRTQNTHKMKWIEIYWGMLETVTQMGEGRIRWLNQRMRTKNSKWQKKKKTEWKFTDDRTRTFPKLAALLNGNRQRAKKREKKRSSEMNLI